MGDRDGVLPAEGLRQLSFFSRGKVEDLEMLAGGSRTGRWYHTITA